MYDDVYKYTMMLDDVYDDYDMFMMMLLDHNYAC